MEEWRNAQVKNAKIEIGLNPPPLLIHFKHHAIFLLKIMKLQRLQNMKFSKSKKEDILHFLAYLTPSFIEIDKEPLGSFLNPDLLTMT